MKRRAARIVIVLILVAAAAAAAYQAVMRSRAIDAENARLAALLGAAARADLALAELSAAAQAYVAPGQGLDFWAGRVDEQLASARDALGAVQAGDALTRLRDFDAIDERARQYARAGHASMAADLVFADASEIVAATRQDLAAAVAVNRAAIDQSAAGERRLQMAALGGLSACALIAALLLLRGPKQEAPAAPSAGAQVAPGRIAPAPSVSSVDDSIGAALDASLEGLNGRTQPTQPTEPAVTATTAPTSTDVPTTVDLGSAADVCVDLARLLDARDLPAVLGRAAEALGAQGLVVWLADATGTSLTPALTHGYAPAVVTRMGSLSIEEDNATSAACRSKSLQLVHGALAAPLLTPAGCTGVLAVEVKDGRERASDVQSLARIVAAQLASGIAAPAAEARKTAEA